MTKPLVADRLQPGSTGESHHRSRARRAAVVGGILAAGTLVCLALYGPAGAVVFLTPGLAVTFGLTLGGASGLVASAVLATVVVGGSALMTDPDSYMYETFLPIFIVVGYVVIVLAWLAGITIRSAWHRARRS